MPAKYIPKEMSRNSATQDYKNVLHCWFTFGLTFLMVSLVGLSSNVSWHALSLSPSPFLSTISSTLPSPTHRHLEHLEQYHPNTTHVLNATRCPSNIAADPAQFQNVGSAVLYILGICIMFVCIHVVCENHFVVAIEQVAENSSFSPDVVGATFMAAGSSAPELFAALMGVIFKESKDVGVGTVVGSTVFNMLIIVGVSILVSPKQEIRVSGRSLFRDCFFYLISLLLLVGFMADGLLSWLDSLIMVLFYVLYTIALLNWQKIKRCLPKVLSACCCGSTWPCCNVDQLFNDDNTLMADDDGKKHNPAHDDGTEGGAGGGGGGGKKQNQDALDDEEGGAGTNAGNSNEAGRQREDSMDMSPPPSTDTRCCMLATQMFLLPFVLLFKYTIPPNDGKSMWRLVASFAVSLLWLMVLVFLMIEWAQKTGCLINISETVMGLTVTAIGTSAPDAFASFIAARKDKNGGKMAISNIFGSNIFDILLALGLPIVCFSGTCRWGGVVVVVVVVDVVVVVVVGTQAGVCRVCGDMCCVGVAKMEFGNIGGCSRLFRCFVFLKVRVKLTGLLLLSLMYLLFFQVGKD